MKSLPDAISMKCKGAGDLSVNTIPSNIDVEAIENKIKVNEYGHINNKMINQVSYGVKSVCGQRSKMEDTFIVKMDFLTTDIGNLEPRLPFKIDSHNNGNNSNKEYSSESMITTQYSDDLSIDEYPKTPLVSNNLLF